jgi:hypothetical protein
MIERRGMTRLKILAGIGGGLALAFVAGACAAAPLSQAADATVRAVATMNLIEQVHGCHRACSLGRVQRWGGILRLHRHVGPACVPVRC